MRLADVLMAEMAEAGAPAFALRWMTDGLRVVAAGDRILLTSDALARIDQYRGTAMDLHELLPAVLPLAHARWWEASITAQHGTEMIMGYLVVPAEGGLDVGWCCYAPAHGRIIGPLGPIRVTADGMSRPVEYTEAMWREARSATGFIIRALLVCAG